MKRKNNLIFLICCFTILLAYVQPQGRMNAEGVNLLVESDRIVITSDEDFETLGFSGTGTEADPYLIENLSIAAGTYFHNIEISNTTKYFVIRNCYIRNGMDGLRLINIADGTLKVINNTVEYHQRFAIWLENSNGVYIANNILGPMNIVGLRIENCSSLIITENTCNENNGVGIVYANSDHITITKNIVLSNVFIGIESKIANNSIIAYNQIENHGEVGVKLFMFSYDNVVHHNNFIGNNLGTGEQQAIDNGESNLWYDDTLLEGNYWDDYDGSGNYSITGSACCCDPYPLSKPYSEESETSFFYLIFILSFIPLAYVIRRIKK